MSKRYGFIVALFFLVPVIVHAQQKTTPADLDATGEPQQIEKQSIEKGQFGVEVRAAQELNEGSVQFLFATVHRKDGKLYKVEFSPNRNGKIQQLQKTFQVRIPYNNDGEFKVKTKSMTRMFGLYPMTKKLVKIDDTFTLTKIDGSQISIKQFIESMTEDTAKVIYFENSDSQISEQWKPLLNPKTIILRASEKAAGME